MTVTKGYKQLIAEARSRIRTLTLDQAKAKFNDPNVAFIDIRDARELEARGLTVRRTDVTPAFVELIRADGHEADLLDPLVDDLGGPYDGVWIDAVLMHVARDEVPALLTRLAAATRSGGTLYLSTQEGDGEEWLTRGHIAAPRHFTLWREEPLRAALEAAGWEPRVVRRSETSSGCWLDVFSLVGHDTAEDSVRG